MFKLVLSIFLLITFCNLKLCAKIPPVEDAYHWREYNGVIPSDALSVGKKNDGAAIYVAQVLFENLLIPGEIVENDLYATFEWGGQARRALNSTMIFCTKSPDVFKWVPYVKFESPSSHNYVVGGYEPDNYIFIGKTIHEGEMVLGKVVINKSFPTWLHAVHVGKVVRFEKFEVLAYAPQPRKTPASSKRIMKVSTDSEDDVADISFSDRNRDCYGGTVVINFN